MIATLVRKLFRDVWVSLLVIALLLIAFECLWARVTYRVSQEIPQTLDDTISKRVNKYKEQMLEKIKDELKQNPSAIMSLRNVGQEVEDPAEVLKEVSGEFFKGPGQIIQALIGGERVDLSRASDMMSVGYLHPVIQIILCIWAIGRASGAIAGEIDRGTMELLLAQPVPRWQLIAAHFCVDVIAIPVLCLSLWAGTWLGAWLMGMIGYEDGPLQVNPWNFGPALLSTAVFIFAVSGYTLWISALGRNRGRVMGIAVLVTLLQFLINLIGQIWEVITPLRPCTVFYYYDPQRIILNAGWMTDTVVWGRLGVLLAVGIAGYGLALWTFSRRDLPAPL
jgi:ABC-2 type transport system permease protein